MNDIAFLFCNDFFDKDNPDSGYADEFFYVKKLGFSVLLFCLDDFLESGKLKIASAEKPTKLIYRGWMITVEKYNALYNALLNKGFTLINSPEQYQQCHHLPSWYKQLEQHTANSVWTAGIPSEQEITRLLESFGNKPLIVKDYVKSRKHEWTDSCFIPNAADKDNAMRIINNFIVRQDNDLIGGVVLREFLSLKSLGRHDKSNMPIAKEIRIFCFQRRPFAYIQYWSGDESEAITECEAIIKACNVLNSNFYTIDLAQQENGEWIIIEVGDGQVSGLQDYSVERFYGNLMLEE